MNSAAVTSVQRGMAFTRLDALASLTLAALLSSGCDIEAQISTATGTFERTVPVSGLVALTVANGAGDVHITPGPDGTVHVVGRITAGESVLGELSAAEKVDRLEATPPIVHDGNRLRIGAIDDRRLTNNVRIDYVITVPARTTVVAKTGSGDQFIGAVSGPVETTAGSGNTSIGPVGSAATVVTGSGDVEVRGARGDVTITAASGDVRASRVAGRLTAKTASGDVDVDGIPDADWSLGTASGDIDVRVPLDARFTLNAATSSGRVEVRHTLDANAVRSRQQASGTVGGGGTRIDLSAASGSIRVQ